MQSITIRNITIGEGIPKICIPIVGTTKSDILHETKNAISCDMDLLEWRADYYENCFDIQKVIEVLTEIRQIAKQIPIIFTFRTKKEGGEKQIALENYTALIDAVMEQCTADIVDIELFSGDTVVIPLIEKAKRYAVKTILSSHDFKNTPPESEIISRLCRMQQLGADITKIAVMPQCKKDVLILLSATEQMQSKYADRPFVTMSMGAMGSISRIVGEIFGSAITFGVGNKSSAPGQIESTVLKQVLQTIHHIM